MGRHRPRPSGPDSDHADAGRPTITAPAIPRLHILTPTGIDEATLASMLRVIDAGAPLVQVRHKEGTDRARLDATRAVVDRCRATGATCLVNDRVDLALAAGAAGVHLGADDLPVEVARRLLGDHAVVGGTARDPNGARRAEDAGATYLGVGPCYPTTTKTGLPEPGGPARVEAVARSVSIPVIAISGVTVERVPELLDAGAWGVAALAAVHSAPDPIEAVAAFLAALGEDGS